MKKHFSLLLIVLSSALMAQPYFQQSVDYTIDVSLDDVNHLLRGTISVRYTNNSNDTLNELYFHQWPNAYRSDKTPLGQQMMVQQKKAIYTAGEKGNGYMDSTAYSSPDRTIISEPVDPFHEIIRLRLSKPVLPNESIEISTPFRVKIPNSDISRLGHIGYQYQITQWYPKPAVYDHNGWNIMPYLNQGEFFSDFGRFEVTIDLPGDYFVGSTGVLQNIRENRLLDSLAQIDLMANSWTKSITGPSKVDRKQLHFVAENVHDFAWFADREYVVRRETFTIPETGEEILGQIFVRWENRGRWQKAMEYLKRSVLDYSDWVGPYPYPAVSAVDGSLSAGAGMEYPMITVIPGRTSGFNLDIVIAHEVGHNWFYGILATNERAHGWMDEGINTAVEMRYVEKYYPNERLFGKGEEYNFIERLLSTEHYSANDENYLTFLVLHRNGLDQPPSDSSQNHSQINYGGMIYSKVGMTFNALKNYVGNEAFDAMMRDYYDTWKFKHPSPKDFWKIIRGHFPEHESWLRKGIETTERIDYRWGSLESRNGQTCVELISVGDYFTPVVVAGMRGDTILEEIRVFPNEKHTEVCFTDTGIERFAIDPHTSLTEWNRRNNFRYNRSFFPRWKPIDLQLYSGLENPEKTMIFWTPNARWNNYDKLMLGLNFKNAGLIRKTFEYDISPLYAFGSNRLTGSAALNYNWVPKDDFPIRLVRLGIYAQTFDYAPELSFSRLSPTLRLEFRKKDQSSALRSNLRLRIVNVRRELGSNEAENLWIRLDDNTYNILEGRYHLENGHWLNPWILNVNAEYTSAFSRISAEWDYRRVVWNERRFALRLFGGFFTHNQTPSPTDYYNFGLSGTTDYLFDYYFLGRSDETGIWSNQMFVTDGGFKSETNTFADQWMTSVNTRLPIWSVLGIYAEGALWKNTDQSIQSGFGYGIEVAFVRDFFEIYLPLPDQINYFNSPYGERIRFVLNLDLDDAFWRVSRGLF